MKSNPFFNAGRRGFLRSMVGGSALFPGLVAQLMAEDSGGSRGVDPLEPRAPHFTPRAKRVIFL